MSDKMTPEEALNILKIRCEGNERSEQALALLREELERHGVEVVRLQLELAEEKRRRVT